MGKTSCYKAIILQLCYVKLLNVTTRNKLFDNYYMQICVNINGNTRVKFLYVFVAF